MSSFKRKTTSKSTCLPPGTRASPGLLNCVLTSTGLPSLDDVLGGGLPLSCLMLVAAPDLHSSYGSLIQKYFVAQGLASKHQVCIIDGRGRDFAREIMWTAPSASGSSTPPANGEENSGTADDPSSSAWDAQIKIAWRYGSMKQFRTTVNDNTDSKDNFCHVFDLTARPPDSVLDPARLTIEEIIHRSTSDADLQLPTETEAECPIYTPLRICIPSLGSPTWGNLGPQDIFRFLYDLRGLIRRHSHVCASISLDPCLSSDTWGGKGWLNRLGWVTDAFVAFSAFSSDPSLVSTFPAYHGLFHIYTLPCPQSLLPPSDKYSTLRGLHATGTGVSGSAPVGASSGENNLAFKCTRKRLVIETLHLDVEGGVSERRTTPSISAKALESDWGISAGGS
ncbi:PAXNEB-domain-containing protein [Fistulina hepatica ATCC 64428]|uniref:Elongator complex protein 4 n=1 Tax=Fistulina hepatica ATCC 64428 TaxID=1128425 RepID=A0A0D7A4R3_9AGAR|nr:PAXNEB-domain-containing protein [Fistulina hepatica ATCC 64428]